MFRPLRLALGLATIVLVGLAPTEAPAAPEWKVVKVGKWDYLTIENIAQFYGLGGELTPSDKSIRVGNSVNQLEVTLDSREAIVNGVRNWFCFPVIANHDGKFLVSRIDLAKTIEPQFRPHMIKNLGRIKTIVLDPGHGGTEKGAASTYGLEKDFCLDVALKLRPMLQAKGFNVIMTREKDALVPLHDRARIANATRDSIFVSIHFNAVDWNRDASGFEIYSLTPRGAPSTNDNHLLPHYANMQAGSPVDAASLMLSTSVYHAMLGHMPEFDRGIKRARFAVLRLTSIPAILVEGGFLTEREESKLIAKSEWRAKLAESIATGIESYRGLVEKRQRPMMLADYRRQFEGVLVARNAATPSSVMPASNRLAPEAQFTSAVHEQPSEQMDVAPEIASAPPPTATAAPPPEIAAQEPPPQPEPAAAPEQSVEPAATADAGEMPTPVETQPEPAAPIVTANGDLIEPAPPQEGPEATPPSAKLTLWQRIGRSLPLPKFRQ